MFPADDSGGGSSGGSNGGEFMLFGVRVVVDSMRKSVSLNNLTQYQLPQDVNNVMVSNNNNVNDDSDRKKKGDLAAGYASADGVLHPASGSRRGGNSNRRRKRGTLLECYGCYCGLLLGIPWTVEEHKLFLLGLQKVGKGDWRGISKNYVKTRTPTQVASHAQKYFLRLSNLNRRRRRSSLFDITTETMVSHRIDDRASSLPIVPVTHCSSTSELNLSLRPLVGSSALSLKLSLPSDQGELPASSRFSAFQALSTGYCDGDNAVSVA